TNSTFYSESTSLTDSRYGNYLPNQYSFIELATPIDLEEVTEIRLQYRAKWELEPRYDHVQVSANIQITNNGMAYYPLCGQYSSAAKAGFWKNQPTYNGFQEDWIFEDIDLTPYLEEDAESLNIMFELRTDANKHYDGFYLDDVKILVNGEVETNTTNLFHENLNFVISPNPSDRTTQMMSRHFQTGDELIIYNAVGQLQAKQILTQQQATIVLQEWKSGLYFCEWRRAGQLLKIEKLVKL
ncbi:MAG: T9SS type A sorting domain-containing protein, partial [Bacteroidota bacterium]